MLSTVLAALLAASFGQIPLYEIQGVLVGPRNEPLAGAVVSVTGPARDRTVTDERGRYRFAGLPRGQYRVRAAVKGFRSRYRDITLTGNTRVDLVLPPGDLVAVDFVVLAPRDAYREADAIARLRIERTLPPQPCQHTASATHEATVLDVIKGTLPSSVLFRQRGAGVCVDEDGVELEGADRAFTTGEDYVVFLRRTGGSVEDLTGPLLTFAVDKDIVETREYGGLPARLPLGAFYDAIRRMQAAIPR